MPTVASYTEVELQGFMENVLSTTAKKLNLSVDGLDFDEPVNEVMYLLGISDVASYTNVRKLRMAARMELWRSVAAATVHEASHSAGAPGTGVVNRADIHRHALKLYELHRDELMAAYPDLAAKLFMLTMLKYPVTYAGDFE